MNRGLTSAPHRRPPLPPDGRRHHRSRRERRSGGRGERGGRLVLDANALIAAFVARGLCAELLEYCVREPEPVTSEAILEEVRRNLVEKVKVSAAQADQTVRLLRSRFEVVEPVALEHPVCRDPDDDVVFSTATAGRCDAIVTGDRDLLDLVTHGGITIVSPRGFWSFEASAREADSDYRRLLRVPDHFGTRFSQPLSVTTRVFVADAQLTGDVGCRARR